VTSGPAQPGAFVSTTIGVTGKPCSCQAASPPASGRRLRGIATVQDPAVVRAILAHLGLAPGPDSPGPAPPQPDHTAATGYPPAGRSEHLLINDGAGRCGIGSWGASV
jgi:hypothetical protein